MRRESRTRIKGKRGKLVALVVWSGAVGEDRRLAGRADVKRLSKHRNLGLFLSGKGILTSANRKIKVHKTELPREKPQKRGRKRKNFQEYIDVSKRGGSCNRKGATFTTSRQQFK